MANGNWKVLAWLSAKYDYTVQQNLFISSVILNVVVVVSSQLMNKTCHIYDVTFMVSF